MKENHLDLFLVKIFFRVSSAEHIFFQNFMKILFWDLKKNQNSQIHLLAKSFQKHCLFVFYDNPEGSYDGLKKQKSQNEKNYGPKKRDNIKKNIFQFPTQTDIDSS